MEDETEIESFGRQKEALQEVDTIRDFKGAYLFGRNLLGGHTTESRRCNLNITSSEESYQPYSKQSVNWGHARILGSDTVSTHYAYSVISVAHTLRDEQINTKIELGSPRPDVSQVLRDMAGRDRYRGESGIRAPRRGSGTPDSVGEGGESTVVSQQNMPTQAEVTQLIEAAAPDSALWVITENQPPTVRTVQRPCSRQYEATHSIDSKGKYLQHQPPQTQSNSRQAQSST